MLTLCADNAALVLDEILDATGTGHAEKLEIALNRALARRQAAAAAGHGDNPFRHAAPLARRSRCRPDPRATCWNARPKPHFSRAGSLEQQLRLWSRPGAGQCARAHLQATSDSRRRPALAEVTLRRALLGICMAAATH